MKSAPFLIALLLIAAPAISQDSVENDVAAIRQEMSKPMVDWTDESIAHTMQKFIDIYIANILWEPTFHKRVRKYLPAEPPKLSVRISGSLRTPYFANDEIVFPVEYLRYSLAIGALVGHDAYEGLVPCDSCRFG